MKFSQQICLVLLCSAISLPSLSQPMILDVEAVVKAKPITEMSGIAKSRSRDDVYWVLNDSGDSARIFAINIKGENVIPTYSKFSYYGEEAVAGKEQWQGFKVLFAENVDWEDMTIDDDHLYISDMGNNGNKRKDLGVYVISEIDPTASTQSASIKHIPVYYPEQVSFPASVWHFDSEGLFSSEGKLYFVTKHRQAGDNFTWEAGANLYRLDTQNADEDNPLIYVDSHAEITAATGAEVSPDGQTLAVLSLTALWLFDKPDTGDEWFSSTFRKIELDTDNVRQTEAVTWIDESTLLITNEQRDMFRINL